MLRFRSGLLIAFLVSSAAMPANAQSLLGKLRDAVKAPQSQSDDDYDPVRADRERRERQDAQYEADMQRRRANPCVPGNMAADDTRELCLRRERANAETDRASAESDRIYRANMAKRDREAAAERARYKRRK